MFTAAISKLSREAVFRSADGEAKMHFQTPEPNSMRGAKKIAATRAEVSR